MADETPPPAKKTRAARTTTRKPRTTRKTTFDAQLVRTTRARTSMPALDPFRQQTTDEVTAVRVSFSAIPGMDEAQKKLGETLQEFMQKVGDAIRDVTTLEVKTYVSDDIAGVKIEKGELVGDLRLRAMTTIALDGDIAAIIPMRAEGMDETLWAAHVDMVKQAQANRTELVKLAASAAAGLVAAVKPV